MFYWDAHIEDEPHSSFKLPAIYSEFPFEIIENYEKHIFKYHNRDSNNEVFHLSLFNRDNKNTSIHGGLTILTDNSDPDCIYKAIKCIQDELKINSKDSSWYRLIERHNREYITSNIIVIPEGNIRNSLHSARGFFLADIYKDITSEIQELLHCLKVNCKIYDIYNDSSKSMLRLRRPSLTKIPYDIAPMKRNNYLLYQSILKSKIIQEARRSTQNDIENISQYCSLYKNIFEKFSFHHIGLCEHLDSIACILYETNQLNDLFYMIYECRASKFQNSKHYLKYIKNRKIEHCKNLYGHQWCRGDRCHSGVERPRHLHYSLKKRELLEDIPNNHTSPSFPNYGSEMLRELQLTNQGIAEVNNFISIAFIFLSSIVISNRVLIKVDKHIYRNSLFFFMHTFYSDEYSNICQLFKEILTSVGEYPLTTRIKFSDIEEAKKNNKSISILDDASDYYNFLQLIMGRNDNYEKSLRYLFVTLSTSNKDKPQNNICMLISKHQLNKLLSCPRFAKKGFIDHAFFIDIDDAIDTKNQINTYKNHIVHQLVKIRDTLMENMLQFSLTYSQYCKIKDYVKYQQESNAFAREKDTRVHLKLFFSMLSVVISIMYCEEKYSRLHLLDSAIGTTEYFYEKLISYSSRVLGYTDASTIERLTNSIMCTLKNKKDCHISKRNILRHFAKNHKQPAVDEAVSRLIHRGILTETIPLYRKSKGQAAKELYHVNLDKLFGAADNSIFSTRFDEY